jgi:hypothetical protein
MAIAFSCRCGADFDVPDDLAGLHAPCPNCHAALVVPAADDEVVEDVEVEDGPTPYRFADPNAPPPAEEAPPAAADTRVDDEEPEVVGDADPAEMTEAEEADEGSPEYFVAAYPPGTSLRQPKTFRLYAYRHELLVLHAGPFAWAQVNLLADRPGVPDAERKKVREAGALGSGMVTDADEFVRRGLARRAAVLDRMTLDELRAEAESDPLSFRVTPETTTRARVEPPVRHEDDDWRAHTFTVGRLKFTHAAAGKWELVLVTRFDALAAVREFRRVLGEDHVDVTLRLAKAGE